MKRMFVLLFMTVYLLSVFPVSASVPNPEVVLSQAEGQPGEQVVVKISITGNVGIAYLKLKVSYDANILTLVKAENTGLLTGSFTTSKTTDVNPYVLQWIAAGNSYGDGVIAMLTFEIREDAAPGEYAVNLIVDGCYDEAYNDVNIDIESGSIAVQEVAPGDANGDGRINTRDARLILMYIAGMTDEIDLTAADFNGDGRVNTRDARAILSHIAGIA